MAGQPRGVGLEQLAEQPLVFPVQLGSSCHQPDGSGDSIIKYIQFFSSKMSFYVFTFRFSSHEIMLATEILFKISFTDGI